MNEYKILKLSNKEFSSFQKMLVICLSLLVVLPYVASYSEDIKGKQKHHDSFDTTHLIFCSINLVIQTSWGWINTCYWDQSGAATDKLQNKTKIRIKLTFHYIKQMRA